MRAIFLIQICITRRASHQRSPFLVFATAFRSVSIFRRARRRPPTEALPQIFLAERNWLRRRQMKTGDRKYHSSLVVASVARRERFQVLPGYGVLGVGRG